MRQEIGMCDQTSDMLTGTSMNGTAEMPKTWMRLMINGDMKRLLLGGVMLVMFLLLFMQGTALADTVTLRADGTVVSGLWTGVNSANLGDNSDASAATITASASTFTVSMENSAIYSGATINSATIFVRS